MLKGLGAVEQPALPRCDGEGSTLEDHHTVEATPLAEWTIWRQDDNGNRFEVSSGHSEEEAERLVAEYEARGHKQHYWTSPVR